jgi:DNA-binding transcriptional regulator GbsR (MarR family)
MREITEHTDQTIQAEILHPAVERFILHWGEMGGQWGVNRSVSQIHALLYISEHPRTAEEIAFVLGIARSNVSNSLKELLAWDLIRRVPVRGDRREHFEAEADVWELVSRIAAGRKAREIDPALAVLRSCVGRSIPGTRKCCMCRRRSSRGCCGLVRRSLSLCRRGNPRRMQIRRMIISRFEGEVDACPQSDRIPTD